MRREIRTFALAAAAALLLVAPATLTFASPVQLPGDPPGSAPSNPWPSSFREAKIVQMTAVAAFKDAKSVAFAEAGYGSQGVLTALRFTLSA